jgi:hypothetical protein
MHTQPSIQPYKREVFKFPTTLAPKPVAAAIKTYDWLKTQLNEMSSYRDRLSFIEQLEVPSDRKWIGNDHNGHFMHYVLLDDGIVEFGPKMTGHGYVYRQVPAHTPILDFYEPGTLDWLSRKLRCRNYHERLEFVDSLEGTTRRFIGQTLVRILDLKDGQVQFWPNADTTLGYLLRPMKA